MWVGIVYVKPSRYSNPVGGLWVFADCRDMKKEKKQEIP